MHPRPQHSSVAKLQANRQKARAGLNGPGGVADADEQLPLSFGFSAGGLVFPYLLGVASQLTDSGVITEETKLGGASAGSLVAACAKSGVSYGSLVDSLLNLAHNCRVHGTQGRLAYFLEQELQQMLPEDIHERCNGSTYIAVTRVTPTVYPELVSQFSSKDDLIQTLLTSCHIPWYLDGQLVRWYRGAYYFDGGITNFIPSPPGTNTVRVCCFPSRQLRRIGGIAISPDTYEEWPYTMNEMLNWAFRPASDHMLLQLMDKGRRDAEAWMKKAQPRVTPNTASAVPAPIIKPA